MALPQVRLLLKDQEVQVRAFPEGGGALRFGRMKENDVVINNLSVSRFHGALRWEEGVFTIEDLGSENGIYLNGSRVEGSAMLEPGDEIAIGKHRMVVEWQGSAEVAPGPESGPSDPWDAATTYLVGAETRAKLLQREPEGADLPAEGADISEAEYADGEAVDVDELGMVELDAEPTDEHEVGGLFASLGAGESLDGEALPVEEIALEPEIEAAVADLEGSGDDPPGSGAEEAGVVAEPPQDLDEVEIVPSDHEPDPIAEELLLVGAAEGLPDTLLIEDAGEAVELAPEAPVASPVAESAARLYAGLILQRAGALQRILSWDAERLTVGRGGDCDIVLATAEVSRRHAMFVREGDDFEVRDLESINGTLVNGNRVGRCTLESGDTVKIEDFELTFVVEPHPIADEIVTQSVREAAAAAPAEADGSLTQLDEVMGLAPYQVGGDSAEVPALAPDPGSEPALPQHEVAPVQLEAAAEVADDEKDLETAPGPATFELEVDVEQLPEPLREALRSAGELRVPVVLRVRE